MKRAIPVIVSALLGLSAQNDAARLDFIEKNRMEVLPPGSVELEITEESALDDKTGWIICNPTGDCMVGEKPDLRSAIDEAAESF